MGKNLIENISPGGPFETIPVDLLKDTDLDPKEFKTYIVIVMHSHRFGFCYASNKEIGKYLGKSKTRVQSYITALKEKSFIRIELIDGYKRKIFPLKYVVSEKRGSSVLVWRHIGNTTGGISDLPQGDIKSDNVIRLNTQMINQKTGILSEDVSSTTGYIRDESLFDAFWEAYPSHIDAKRTKKALYAIKNLDDIFPTIMRALDRQKRTKRWMRGYIPNPFRWLADERWKDEIKEDVFSEGESSSWTQREAAENDSDEKRRMQDEAARLEIERLG